MKNLAWMTIALLGSTPLWIHTAQSAPQLEAGPSSQLNLKLADGYPYCEDVMATYSESVKQKLLGLVSDEKLKRQMGNFALTLQELEEQSKTKGLSDFPDHPIRHPLDPRPYSGGGYFGGCFEEKTSIVVLRGSKKQEIQMNQVDRGDFVLSSTRDLFKDDEKEFRVDCWGQVIDRYAGEVKDKEKYEMVDVQTSQPTTAKPATSKSTLKVTPRHRFFCKSGESDYTWTRAANLKPGDQLMLDCQGGVCTVTGKTENVAADYSWYNFGHPTPTVFNIINLAVQWTHTYYVGPEKTHVLVHNMK